jgi:hypothetical protein
MAHATINGVLRYLKPLPQWELIKPFQIVGNPSSGTPRKNLEFSPHEVPIQDARDLVPAPSLDIQGFEWINHSTQESLDSEESIRRNITEMEHFLAGHLKARFVRAFEFQVCHLMPSSLPSSNSVPTG